ncbi:angiopoietin-related protein 6-like [Haematobia irritans]|uniref:angiopoietin-related protein 6-like n=1 Tax=Haematobia irritans TaxID=7368 RepID=UPI003F4F548B
MKVSLFILVLYVGSALSAPETKDRYGHDDLGYISVRENNITVHSLDVIEKRSDENCQSNPWITILRRQDGLLNFHRSWDEYKEGFGDPSSGEFFIGLQTIYEMTTKTAYELLIELEDWDNEGRYAFYDHFKIGREEESYHIRVVGTYRGDAGDALTRHTGRDFATYDRDREGLANKYKGGWWFDYGGYDSHLFGSYKTDDVYQAGVSWDKWRRGYSMKSAEMKLRKKIV